MDNGRWKNKSKESKSHTHEVNKEIKETIGRQPASSEISGPVTLEQLMDAILCLKRGKARGIDLVHTEFLCHMGFCALDWLLLSNCLDTLSIPAVCWHAKVVEILKPKKPADEPRATDQSRYSASHTN